MIWVDAVWLAVEPLDLRIGLESALARVVAVFGAAQPHHAYPFTNRQVNGSRYSLVHDGFGLWLAVRRLHQGRFLWAAAGSRRLELTREQFDALVLGLPWQRLGAAGVINLV